MNSNQGKNALSYIPGLDGIRGLSALLVIGAHWPNYLLSLKFGWIGVNIFFVLSGFLITRILVHDKDKPLKDFLTIFYYKRLLRIFPLYYLYILIFTILILAGSYYFPILNTNEMWEGAKHAVHHDLPYYLTYTYNLKINLRYFFNWPDTSNHFFGHLWSLAVEEQFYLIFPFIVYFSSQKGLKRTLLFLIIVCPLIRLYASLHAVHLVTDKYWLGELIYSNTFCQSDSLAWGALLAISNFNTIKHPKKLFYVAFGLWLIAGLAVLVGLRRSGIEMIEGKSLGYNFPGFWFTEQTGKFILDIRPFYQYTLVNLLAVSLILPATLQKPVLPLLFNSKWLSYLGKTSYGIYLLHNPLIAIVVIIADANGGWGNLTSSPIREISIFVVYVITVIGLAHLSYQYFEKKVMKYRTKLSLVEK